MSGGPPHHPHSRQAPITNTAWNHLQVPNFYANRPPQHAHMSNEHPLLHQPTWHTPTTEPMKSTLSHSHLFNLEQMLSERQYSRPSPGVDLTLTRNGNSQNGDLPTTPISLSVRDTNKINSLPPGALDIQAVELTKSLSPGLKAMTAGIKSISPGLKSTSPGLKSTSPGLISTNSVLMSTNPGLMSINVGLKSASPGLKSASPGLKSASPGLKSASPGLKSASPVLKSASPGLKSASPVFKSTSPILKSSSPGLKLDNPNLKLEIPNIKTGFCVANLKSTSPGIKSSSPCLSSALNLDKQNSPKTVKRSNKRVDSILERLNPMLDKTADIIEFNTALDLNKINVEKAIHPIQSVIVQPTGSSHDENSNSSSILNVPTPTNIREEDVVSPYSNEDSLDSNKSRRKRKPSKTVRVSKEDEKVPEDTEVQAANHIEEANYHKANNLPVKEPEESRDEIEDQLKKLNDTENCDKSSPKKTRRKSSSESETIDNIAAMVHQKEPIKVPQPDCKPVSVIKQDLTNNETNESAHSTTTLITPAQRKATNFVEVENKLEEMFAGIEENSRELSTTEDMEVKTEFVDNDQSNNKNDKLDCTIPSTSSQSHDNVTSTSNEILTPTKNQKNSIKKSNRQKRKRQQQRGFVDNCYGSTTPKKKKSNKKMNKNKMSTTPKKNKKSLNGKQIVTKVDVVKDVYAYDSGSNTSSTKSRGPFVQIKGPRESPIAVNIINTPANEDDVEKKSNKPKKFHDDSEYRYKVKSKGLHSSTLSNKYDAQTRDISWICAFCKRGPHATEPNTTGPSTYKTSVAPSGDLYGPYIITTQSPEFERRLDDPYDKQFISKKQCRTVDIITNNTVNKVNGKKNKRKHSDSDRTDENDVHLGITETSDRTYEIWVHENCVVWSPGIYLIGHKIIGLEEAVWTSCNVNCLKCNFKGANVCCLRRGCVNVMHYGCAKTSDWQLDNDNYKGFCNLHKTLV